MAVLVTFLQTASSASDLQTYTFASQNLGAAAAGRYIIVAVMGRVGSIDSSITSVTVGGVTASIAVQVTRNDSPNSHCVGLAIASVPTGTTGDIVVVFSTTMLRAFIGAYSTDAAPVLTDTKTSSVTDPSATIAVAAGGFVVGVSTTANAASTAAWTGITENYDADVEASSATGASDNFASANSALAVAVDWSTSNFDLLALASWGPGSHVYLSRATRPRPFAPGLAR
jgi:hypothetical protein